VLIPAPRHAVKGNRAAVTRDRASCRRILLLSEMRSGAMILYF